jgi:DNA gyrase inhibitor GyrI
MSNKVKAHALEEPAYSIIEKQGKFEIRQYESYIVAETMMGGNFKEAGNEGFRRIFKYISGENRARKSISMTAPVNIKQISEIISMTAPVNLQKADGSWIITFFMPSEYSMDTLPEPEDSRIVIKQVEAKKVAALRYSGTWSKDRYERKKLILLKWMTDNQLSPAGGPIFARYNSPFSLWFLRRNEVLVPIEDK